MGQLNHPSPPVKKGECPMQGLKKDDLLTRVTRYNLIRDQRMLYIDVHETLHGNLAAPFLAVPNLINIIARQEFQGTGMSEVEALEDCLKKIASVPFEGIFPEHAPPASASDDSP
jgi:hypothetical protein